MTIDTAYNGWEASAGAWIAEIGEAGDFGRQHVLDTPMLARLRGAHFTNALDVGCGEGRFCRMLASLGIETTGIDPAPSLLAMARQRDPAGRYLDAVAETLPFENDSFDLVVSYLTLIDIDDIEQAITEMARVLKPNGSLLIANLNSYNTAGTWTKTTDGSSIFVIDNYLEDRPAWVSWRGISVRNWHRPLGRYMQLLLGTGLQLVHFEEPAPVSEDAEKNARYSRVPYFHVMEWRKPAA
ncbi:class I SAM-dependent methyltransferase [Oryzifoliimicrobium ureilyticus]|uniref:class I SAM-dependent methyltransferase n=1 Tax=Oryzifoliimicrobium ureilyticus TaxID=3113724 RepID=UPI0030763D4D